MPKFLGVSLISFASSPPSPMSQPVLVNIAVKARLHEAGYRYRREQLRVVHERFNGSTTRLINVDVIARQLQASPQDLERGLVRNIKKKMTLSTCGPLTFPGHHPAELLDLILQEMIEHAVLCPQCRLPEWNRVSCNACGYQVHKAKAPSKATGKATGKARAPPKAPALLVTLPPARLGNQWKEWTRAVCDNFDWFLATHGFPPVSPDHTDHPDVADDARVTTLVVDAMHDLYRWRLAHGPRPDVDTALDRGWRVHTEAEWHAWRSTWPADVTKGDETTRS